MRYTPLEAIDPYGFHAAAARIAGFTIRELDRICKLEVESSGALVDDRLTVVIEAAVRYRTDLRVQLSFLGAIQFRLPSFGSFGAAQIAVESITHRQWDRIHYRVITLDDDCDEEIPDLGLSLLCREVKVSVVESSRVA